MLRFYYIIRVYKKQCPIVHEKSKKVYLTFFLSYVILFLYEKIFLPQNRKFASGE